MPRRREGATLRVILFSILGLSAFILLFAASAVTARFSVSVFESGLLIRIRITALRSLVRVRRVLLIRFFGPFAFRPLRLTKEGFTPVKKRRGKRGPGLELFRRVLGSCRVRSLEAEGGLFLEDAAASVFLAGAVNAALEAVSDAALIAVFTQSEPRRRFAVLPRFDGGPTRLSISGMIEAKAGMIIKDVSAELLRRKKRKG